MLLSSATASFRRFSFAFATVTQPVIEKYEFNERRKKLVSRVRNAFGAETLKQAIVVVAAAAKQQYSGPDVPYPYRQCSYFRYLTGVIHPKSILTIIERPNSHPVSTLYVTPRSSREELWEGPALKSEILMEKSGVDEVRSIDCLASDLEKVGPAIGSYDTNQFGAGDSVFEILSPYGRIIPLREEIDALRWVKSSAEQQIMRKTCDIGAKAMNGMVANCCEVTNENEIVGNLENEMRRRGAAYLAYPPVVAGGSRANIIHYLDANQALKSGDTVLVDAGCDYEGYASDISRVFPISGKFSSSQKALYDALLHVHEKVITYAETVRPLTLNNMYLVMLDQLSKSLSELGLFTDNLSSQQLVHEADKLCPHHVSHYLGMDVHDTATVPRNIPVVPGVVFTIEPGVYIRPDNKNVKKEFRGLGMRIEDDVLTTDNGSEVLTQPCLRGSDEIEGLMRLYL